MLQGQKDLVTVGHLILSELAPVVGAQQAEFYVLDPARDVPRLKLLASYASTGHGAYGKEIDLGQGIVGQCAFDKKKILLTEVHGESFRITSGLSEMSPQNVLVLPIIFEGYVKGVVELASMERFNPIHQAFLDQLTESIGIVINTIEANMRTEDLLTQSQSLAQELQSRQQELQQTNEELQEKARLLAHQNQEVERKNQEVEQARQALEEKAKQLALTSKYKSEFLANMSHELRTPLNSLLILSDQLCKNSDGNLTSRQIEFSKTIHSSGNDLLALINDILDLSKIESGTVVVDVSELRLTDLQLYVERTFRHMAESKAIDFIIHMGMQLPTSMITDLKRLQQILKNLLSNAFKFTHQGHVTLSIEEVVGGWSSDNEELNRAHQVLAFSVSDTGIGISSEKQQIIFEAFQQADGSTSRKYGGTGLGLAISRELSKLLGGEIRLTSAPGKGSTFTLYLPYVYTPPRALRKALPERHGENDAVINYEEQLRLPTLAKSEVDAIEVAALVNEVGDDRDVIQQGDLVLLIVENDLGFARLLLEVAREKGFRGLMTSLGAGALTLAKEYKPAAITLDMFLPDMQGWRVLDRLKHDLFSRHIPVCVISTDDSHEMSLQSGAHGFISKPIQSREIIETALDDLRRYVSRRERNILLVMTDGLVRKELTNYMKDDDIDAVIAMDGAAALRLLQQRSFDCVVLDSAHCELKPDELLRAMRGDTNANEATTWAPVPMILYRQGETIDDGDTEYAAANFGVYVAHSLPQLLDRVVSTLHRNAARMPESQRLLLEKLHELNRPLANKKVLIVDDDMRNIFALATVLEEYGMINVWAENGRDAINLVKNDPEIDIVLMDIMMPEMDGMDTMQEIRKLPAGRDLPMIAVTAKAMKGDREKCIEAGAWDYLSKPVNTMDLLAVLRAWLHR
jgi:signal transduction histidine kinase/DNA-binding response OmpR family regulator